ncbi:hypothetical protein ACIQYW_04450 [Rhodococcus erythropolis]|uniref:Uncharacterized protein n=1 Tax=Rhodococcus baikonurensis TaxID=172041 RepID=A0ABV5XDS8_9NOCA|nr:MULTISPECIES: hypothetical protein [Rhodococcus]MBJ7479919.1 hypothetical protein [Rhodococcus sp. (in: high G+C Gram-positive bacteria)]NHP17713.1 hypothetical protein [Rhodococcus sp. IC4_135]QQM21908.1 hypothetical protein I7X09_28915 [Rhodococcus sp. P-2]
MSVLPVFRASRVSGVGDHPLWRSHLGDFDGAATEWQRQDWLPRIARQV